jgi:hypothetical protein
LFTFELNPGLSDWFNRNLEVKSYFLGRFGLANDIKLNYHFRRGDTGNWEIKGDLSSKEEMLTLDGKLQENAEVWEG